MHKRQAPETDRENEKRFPDGNLFCFAAVREKRYCSLCETLFRRKAIRRCLLQTGYLLDDLPDDVGSIIIVIQIFGSHEIKYDFHFFFGRNDRRL